MNNIIEINNLSKSFGDIKAVNNISFKVKEGEFFSFLGVNGAGKSTTISMMCGERKSDSGSIVINGINVDDNLNEIKKMIGVVFQSSVLDKELSVKDNLLIKASLYGIVGDEFKNKLNELEELLDLNDILKRPIKKLSGGQKRRVDIARALIHDPKILILDEPTTGLDPQTRKMVWNVINKLRKEKGITVFLTTHYMEEAAESDYVVILDSGNVVAKGSPLDLKNEYTGDFIILYNCKLEDIKKLNLPFERISNGYKISVANTQEATNLIINNKDIFIDYEIYKGKMDDVFLNVTGKKLGGN